MEEQIIVIKQTREETYRNSSNSSSSKHHQQQQTMKIGQNKNEKEQLCIDTQVGVGAYIHSNNMEIELNHIY